MTGSTQLVVPAQYVDLFRLGTVHEIGHDADWVRSTQRELVARAIGGEGGGDLPDLRTSKRHLDTVIGILDQVDAATGDVTIVADAANLAHVLEAMTRDVIAPRIIDEAGFSPIQHEGPEKLAALAGALLWVTEHVGRLHGEAVRAEAVA